MLTGDRERIGRTNRVLRESRECAKSVYMLPIPSIYPECTLYICFLMLAGLDRYCAAMSPVRMPLCNPGRFDGNQYSPVFGLITLQPLIARYQLASCSELPYKKVSSSRVFDPRQEVRPKVCNLFLTTGKPTCSAPIFINKTACNLLTEQFRKLLPETKS
jgi:hypothetical protein